MSNDEQMVVLPFDETQDKIDSFRGQKMPWDKRVDQIKTTFPSVTNLDWRKVFQEDITILGNIINDIMRIDLAEPGKPGKRPNVDPLKASIRLRELQGDDYTMLGFTDSFKILAKNLSIRGLAAKTGLDRNVIVRLQKGGAPTAKEMEAVARGFKKDPGFFLEYRLSYLFGILYRKLEVNPEATVGFYRKIKGLAK